MWEVYRISPFDERLPWIYTEAIPISNQLWGNPHNLKVVLYNLPQIRKEKISDVFMMGEWGIEFVHVEYVASMILQEMFCKQCPWARITKTPISS